MRREPDDPEDFEDLFIIDEFGRMKRRPDTTGMHFPVRCTHCDEVYDVGKVTVTARYSDCSMWNCPGCRRQVDDRPGWGGSRGDIEKLY